ncbi:MAG: ferrous iron transport protein B [Candidatus Hydrothermarchaeota archaeon]
MQKKALSIALAGNANVGKSVIFNHLTGLHQHIGNWPGKTVEKAEGTLHFKGYTIDVIDLPGIYSLSTFSIEELISREYIVMEKPDIVINVIDASVLERNLFFTIQLLELETPMIIALNQIDLAERKGVNIDHLKLQNLLGIPVVPTVATKGTGIYELLEKSIDVIEGKKKINPLKIKYSKEIEVIIEKIENLIKRKKSKYPPRWVAVKLLEGDEEVKKMMNEMDTEIVSNAEKYAEEIEKAHGEPCSMVIASERYKIAHKIANEVQKIVTPKELGLVDKLDSLTIHKYWGYPIMIGVILILFFSIFKLGDFLSGLLGNFFTSLRPYAEILVGKGKVFELIWGGIFEGIIAGISIALPYIVPFYVALSILEDSGYLTRIAFLMDNVMHKMGLHGKAFIPLMLGYGCNVPACLGCRIMETQRERFLAAFVATLVPCAARTVVILGLVGAFVGMKWAIALYLVDLLIIFILGRFAFKVLPGEPVDLIMEMPPYRLPSLAIALKRSWFRLKGFIYIAFPLIIAGSLLIKILDLAELLEPIAKTLDPVIVGWLGLPSIVGIVLIFGILRKELTLIMLAAFYKTTNFLAVLTPVQMIVLAFVTMLYIPCIATIAVLIKEFGVKRALYITFFEIVFALFLGGIAFRLLAFVM